MKPTIKGLMMVSILLLACIGVFEAAYAQPRDNSETGFNPASVERAGPTRVAHNVFAIESFAATYDTFEVRVVAAGRTPSGKRVYE